VSDKVFFERVLPNPAALIWTLILPMSIFFVLVPINQSAGIVIAATAFTALLTSIWFAAPVIEFDSGQLTVGSASIERAFISEVEVIAKEDAFAERGPKLSPLAYVRFQPTVNTLLKVYISDPNDPTPYWLFATRRASELSKVLQN
jgi:hypothetical protein